MWRWCLEWSSLTHLGLGLSEIEVGQTKKEKKAPLPVGAMMLAMSVGGGTRTFRSWNYRDSKEVVGRVCLTQLVESI